MREESDELSEEIMDELWSLIDGSRDGFWPGVDRLCARHPQRATEIRREAAALLGEAESPRSEPKGTDCEDLPEAIEAEVCAIVFGERVEGAGDAGLREMCRRHATFASSIRRLATVLRAQVADMRRRLGDVWRLTHAPGRYEVIEELGGGSFGSVSIVRDRLLGRRVAMKTIHSRHGTRLHQIAPWKVHRFIDEAQIAAQLRHPGIPLVHDLGIGEFGVPYFTMRHVRGQTLGMVLQDLGRDVRSAVRLLVSVADAVTCAHAQRVLHRDIKPDNIVVGRFGEVCVIDWGLAWAWRGKRGGERRASVHIDRSVDLNSGGMGSEGYMAPEQRLGTFGPAGDVYSLAAILHLSLVGRPPLVPEQGATFSLPKRIWKQDRWLAEICTHGLAPRVEDRYATMEDILADLKAYLADRPPAAFRPRARERLRAGWRRLWRGMGRWRAPAADGGTRRERAANGAGRDLEARPVARGDYTLVTESPVRGRAGHTGTGESRSGGNFDRRLEAVRELCTPAARYRETRLVATGGMGRVHEAHDDLLGRGVAVKTVRAGLESFLGQRLLDEAQIAAQVDHPSILTVHEISVDDEGTIHVVMPLVDGGTLADVIRRASDRTQAARVLLRVAWGLAFAHQKGVVHRDIKPWNILFGKHGDAYLADWGLAMLVGNPGRPQSRIRVSRGPSLDDGAEETQSEEEAGNILGTPNYMSPEAARGEVASIGPHSDVWSLGVVLYEIIAGRHPYGGEHVFRQQGVAAFQRMFDAIVIPAARSVDRTAPKSVAAVCSRALQPNPLERYANAEEFALALEAALA